MTAILHTINFFKINFFLFNSKNIKTPFVGCLLRHLDFPYISAHFTFFYCNLRFLANAGEDWIFNLCYRYKWLRNLRKVPILKYIPKHCCWQSFFMLDLMVGFHNSNVICTNTESFRENCINRNTLSHTHTYINIWKDMRHTPIQSGERCSARMSKLVTEKAISLRRTLTMGTFVIRECKTQQSIWKPRKTVFGTQMLLFEPLTLN